VGQKGELYHRQDVVFITYRLIAPPYHPLNMPTKIRQNRKIPKIRLIHRQQKWTLTAQGWGIAIACATSLIIFTFTHIHPFLAVTSPLKADVLVVEGWLPDYAIKQALIEFESGSYRQIITTGGRLERGSYLAEYKNFAELSAATLKALGLEKEKLVAVPAPEVIKYRTYASAAAFRQWLSDSDLKLESINLYTFDVHARRSWLLFKQVLAPKIKVGVISAETREYDPKNWWSSSAGMRSISSETIAYIYARFVNLKA
jgi:hypothetical protein